MEETKKRAQPTQTFLDKLKNTFQDYEEEIPIITHNYPDPDAISSALGMVQILKLLGLKPGGIYYTGEISHPQNKSLVTVFNITLINYEKIPFESGVKAVCVDISNVGEGTNQTGITDVNIKAVVDHHKSKAIKGAISDIRHVGSCASIIWSLLTDLNFDFSSDEGCQLATALLVGLKTDTQDLTSETAESLDFEAQQHLIKYIDRQKFVSIINYPLPEYYFELKQRANEVKYIANSTIVAGVGIISPAKRDIIPVIADEFLRMSGIETSIIFAIIDDCIDVSMRSINITVDIEEFLQTVFKTGGGKKGAGRAKIPLGFFELNGIDNDAKNALWEVVKTFVIQKVMTNVKGD